MNNRQNLIRLLGLRSVTLGTFRLASGRESSYYIDARRTTMAGEGLELVGRLGRAAFREAGWNPDTVGGLTLGADPVAYAIALESRRSPPTIDAFTVRTAAKDHGTGRRIEGCFEPGNRVVVVEDVITTGRSALDAVRAVREAGGEVLGILAVVDREEGGRATIEGEGLRVVALLTARDLGLEPTPP